MSTALLADKIEERMEVVCSKGMRVGTVDHVLGDQIELTRDDSEDGMHHRVPASMVCSVDTRVHLTRPLDEVRRSWTSG